MRLFKEIKRRAHNVAQAIAGKGPGWQEKLGPVKLTINQMRVETFAAEQSLGLIVDEFVKPEVVMDHYRRGLAAEIGHKLLDEGFLVEEISQRPHELGLRGPTLRLTVRVVRPEEEGAV